MATDAVAEIKARLDIVDVVGGYTTLTRSGRSYKALCPFHSERTPSFTVSQEKQAWYCFGCSEGGDVFSFVQKIEHADFRSVLQQLAERAGVELEERDDPAQQGASRRRRRTRDLNTKAAAYFSHVLWETPAGEPGRELLRARGVDETQAKAFGIGFAPSGGGTEDALVRYLVARGGATLDEIVEAGLGHQSRGGGGRDRFRHRLVFPIRDDRAEVIAFGARALGDDQPKYLNSPETAVYHKSLALFGIDMARDAIRSSETALIVEGYFDVVAAHVAGIANVVASSGTALTREQVKILGRYAKTVILCFDSDSAGTAAAAKAVDLIAAEGLAARIVVLPDGIKDPDELVQADPKAFAAAVAAARPEWQVLLDRALADGEGGSLEARRTAAERTIDVLRRIPEASTRDLYVQQAANRLELATTAVQADVAKARRETQARPGRVVVSAPVPAPPMEAAGENEVVLPPPDSSQSYIAAAVASWPALASVVLGELGLGLDELNDPAVRRIVEVAQGLAEGEELPLHPLTPSERSLASRLLLDPPPELDPSAEPTALARALASAVWRIREARLRRELDSLQRELRLARDSGRDDDVASLAARLVQLRLARDSGNRADARAVAARLPAPTTMPRPRNDSPQ